MIGATAGVPIYLCAVCYGRRCLRQPNCAHSGGTRLCPRSPVSRLEGVLGSSRRCGRPSGGVWVGDARSIRDSPSLSSSESLLLQRLYEHLDVHEENERHSSPHAVLVGPTGCRLVSNEPKHSSPKRFTGRCVLTSKERTHDSIASAAPEATTTSLSSGVRPAQRHRCGARSRSAHAAARPGGPPHPPASSQARARGSSSVI